MSVERVRHIVRPDVLAWIPLHGAPRLRSLKTEGAKQDAILR
jgi:hypothetical protein